jgi:hypothetical protein
MAEAKNKPVYTKNRGGHHIAVFRSEGKFGPFLKANIEFRIENSQGERTATSYFTIAQLEADIARRSFALHKMYELEEQIKLQRDKTVVEKQQAVVAKSKP